MLKENMQKVALILISGSLFLCKGNRYMENNDKLHLCADLYAELSNYEYTICMYNNGTIINTTIGFDESGFMHLAGLEKLTDLTEFSDTSSSRLYNNIIGNVVTYQEACSSSFWNVPLNDPQKNGVIYTLDDRIDTLTHFRDILNNSQIKAYLWDSNFRRTPRPYSSEISADFMLVFDTSNKKTSDERVYAFFKLDSNNPEVAHGVSQFPTDRTYSNDGRVSVPEVTIMSLIEHDKVNNVDRCIIELPVDERQQLTDNALRHSVNSIVEKDLKQLKSKRYKYYQAQTEATRRAYERKLKIFDGKTPYTTQMLKEAADRLATQAQDPHNSEVKDLMLKEIDLIKQVITDREQSHAAQTSVNVTLSINTSDDSGTVSVNPIMSIKIPHALTKVKGKAKLAAHLVSVSVSNFFTDISDSFKKAALMFRNNDRDESKKKVHSSKPKKKPPVKSGKPEKPVDESTQDKEPLFSIAEIKSDRYAPVSDKEKSKDKAKNNNLDI